jgi:hypothetical protein
VLEGLLRVHATSGMLPVEHAPAIVEELAGRFFKVESGGVLAALVAGPGSKQQLQLSSLMCSLLKLCNCIRPLDPARASMGYGIVAFAASTFLCEQGTRTVEPAPAAAAAGATVPGTSAAEGLPWLVVIGRCCSAWTTQLQQLQDSRPGLGQQLLLLL